VPPLLLLLLLLWWRLPSKSWSVLLLLLLLLLRLPTLQLPVLLLLPVLIACHAAALHEHGSAVGAGSPWARHMLVLLLLLLPLLVLLLFLCISMGARAHPMIMDCAVTPALPVIFSSPSTASMSALIFAFSAP
jgi:hypothetical protein